MKEVNLVSDGLEIQISDKKINTIFRLLFLALLLLIGFSSLYLSKKEITAEAEQIIILNSHTVPSIELPPLKIEI
ncbi:hypothetical protein N9N67_09960 [Bacteriovoracaceae bacterium]|nr:hypothetical protein [Bacteriovoracaceae bacterium]